MASIEGTCVDPKDDPQLDCAYYKLATAAGPLARRYDTCEEAERIRSLTGSPDEYEVVAFNRFGKVIRDGINPDQIGKTAEPFSMKAFAELRGAAVLLLRAYDAEESEHGFPFSFELREAHRRLRAAVGNYE